MLKLCDETKQYLPNGIIGLSVSSHVIHMCFGEPEKSYYCSQNIPILRHSPSLPMHCLLTLNSITQPVLQAKIICPFKYPIIYLLSNIR